MSQIKEELKSAMNQHMDLMSDLVEKFSGELRAGLQPAVDNFLSFFHAIDWKNHVKVENTLFHVLLCHCTLLSSFERIQRCLITRNHQMLLQLESDRDIIPRHLNHTDEFFSVQLVIQRAVVIEILHASGDQTTDIGWYVKCTVLGGIYSAAVV
ncbi:hypothetical protein MKW92_019822 [Papaver armeniacum]|nr:hypothetical protein MKW92_019822 [Papaver armeniacum]